jgi:hypothetical protein
MADLEQLSVTLSAKIDDFKRGMQDAVRDFDQSANQIEQKNLQLTQNISRQMDSTAASVRVLSNAFKGLVSVYAFEQLIQGAIKANTEIAQLARTADLAGVSVRKLQEIQYAGKTLGGADTGDVTKAAHDLSLAVYKEVREGEGELSKFLEANNMKLTDRNGKAKDFNELMTMAATLLQRAGSEAQAIDIGRLFHLSEDMVRALEKGPAALQRAQDAAKSAGAILDEDVVQKAKDFDQLWNQSWSNFSTYAKSAAVSALAALAPVGTYLEEKFKNLPGYLAAVSRGINATEGGGGPETDAERLSRAGAIGIPGNLFQNNRGITTGQQFGPNLPSINDPRRGKDAGDKADEFEREEKRIQKQINALEGQAAAIGKVGEAAGVAEARERLFIAAEAAGYERTPELTARIEKLAEAYGKIRSALDTAKLEQDVAFERIQIGRTPDEQAIASRTRRLAADDAERLGKSLRENQNLLEGKEMAASFVKGLISDLENGVKAGQALENQLKRILEKLADKGIDKLISAAFGGVSGLFGGGGYGASDYASAAASAAPGSYGPGFASGGLVGRDGTPTWIPAAALRGARQFAIGGGIPAILHAGEIVLNQAQQKNVASSMGGPKGNINLTHAPVINGTGLSKEEVFSVIQRSQKEFARHIGPIFSDWQRRFQ